MAIVYEDHCIECCKTCVPTFCKYLDVRKHVCDRCGKEKPVYDWQGEEVCRDCIFDDLDLEKIE